MALYKISLIFPCDNSELICTRINVIFSLKHSEVVPQAIYSKGETTLVTLRECHQQRYITHMSSNNVRSKVSRRSGILNKKLRSCFNTDIILALHCSYIYSYFICCVHAWGEILSGKTTEKGESTFGWSSFINPNGTIYSRNITPLIH